MQKWIKSKIGWKGYLAVDGGVGSKFCIAPGNEFEVNDGDEVSGEDFGKVIDDEVGAVWAQAFIVQF